MARKKEDIEPEAFGPLAREFVRLLTERTAVNIDQQKSALDMAEWLHRNRLMQAERMDFRAATGWVFEYELAERESEKMATKRGVVTPDNLSDNIPF